MGSWLVNKLGNKIFNEYGKVWKNVEGYLYFANYGKYYVKK